MAVFLKRFVLAIIGFVLFGGEAISVASHCQGISNLYSVKEESQQRELLVGTSSKDITPPLPVALDGQMYLRVADTIETPVTANVIALEQKGRMGNEISIWVSADLVTIPNELKSMVRERIRKALPEVDSRNIIINATHTHTGPAVRDHYKTPEEVTTIEETHEFIANRIAESIQEAWNNRAPGSVSWGLGHAKIAYNRRAVYYNGSAKMYGQTDLPEFRGLEGYEDNDLQALFFWDEEGQLIATSINVSGPSQTVEHRSAVNADYWHPVREQLKNRFGSDLVVLGWTGAAGDQSPRPMYGDAGEQRMRKLKNIDRLEQLARRIVVAVEDIYETVQADQHQDIELIHETKTLQLPMRLVTVEALNKAKSAIEEIESDPEARIDRYRQIAWNQKVIDRYEKQIENPNQTYEVEINVLRLGDIVIATNPFELFTEFGIRMKARSEALQTFVIQLVGPGNYLPTMEAVEGGHYSAVVPSNEVGPEGGQILVDRTVELINRMWNENND